MAARTQSKRALFLSYAHADSKVAFELVEALKAAGFDTWHDRDPLPGDNWAAVIDRQLRESGAMVVLLSPAWAASPWLRHEVSFALEAPRFEGRLIPVLLEETKGYPWILDRIQMIEYKNSEITGREIARVLGGPGRKGPAPLEHGQEKRRNTSRS